MNEKQFILEFERVLTSRFGIDLNDVDKHVALGCCKDEWSPEETVEWLGKNTILMRLTHNIRIKNMKNKIKNIYN
jgi:hypothetical protein